jgi:hypothetical protein
MVHDLGMGSHMPPRPQAQRSAPPLSPAAPSSASVRSIAAGVPRGPVAPFCSLGSACPPRAWTGGAPSSRSRRRNRPGRGHSSCRPASGRGIACIGAAGPILPPARSRLRMDGVREICYRRCAYVHDTMRRHGAEPAWQLVGAVPAISGSCHCAICADARRMHTARQHQSALMIND